MSTMPPLLGGFLYPNPQCTFSPYFFSKDNGFSLLFLRFSPYFFAVSPHYMLMERNFILALTNRNATCNPQLSVAR